MNYNWSKYQTSIFNEVATGTQHCIINAVAGSGKSTALIESLNHIPPGSSWLLIAFNKKIAEELKTKVAIPGNISTIHAVGLRSLGSAFPRLTVNTDKLHEIIEKLIGKTKEYDYKALLAKTVDLSKATLAKDDFDIDEVMDRFDIDLLEHNREDFINNVLTCIERSRKDTKTVDFMDMVFLPNVHKLKVKKYDFVCIDEFQDLNSAQINFALQLCKKKGRVFCFGDPRQSIYSFTAAGYNEVLKAVGELKPKMLPLSVSYRCPTSVVEEAKKYVPEIESAPNAIQGEVRHITEDDLYKLAKPGCFVLSRSNAPQLKIALRFIRAGVPTVIRGRDIGSNLLSFVQNSKAKSISALKTYIDNWKDKETERLKKKNKDVTPVSDKWECLNILAEDHKTVEQITDRLKTLFSDTDEKTKITISSVHRAKGDEREEVFVLWNTFFGDDEEANNLRYVAITRSKDKLYYVKSKKKDINEEE